MKPQAKLLPGDIGIIVGMLAVLGGAIWLPIVLFSEMPHYSALKRDGRTVVGQIVGKHSELSAGARRQRKAASENFFFEISFDPARGVPFGSSAPARSSAEIPATPRTGKDIVAGLSLGKATGSQKTVASGPARVRVNAGTFERFEAHRIGDAISVSYLPSDPAGAKLTELAESANPWLSLAAAAGLLLSGAGLSLVGFRRRKTNAEAVPAAK